MRPSVEISTEALENIVFSVQGRAGEGKAHLKIQNIRSFVFELRAQWSAN